MQLTPMALAIYQAYGKQDIWFAAAWRMERVELGKHTNWRLVLPDVWGRFA